ncbi:hypothetical protein EAL2_808p07110 (plasmid) [Peptoclostridium acidaminophilum DSM 3953]|uniref:DUF2877 domain-containing protein n=1 Tax=Peptoclostridium acidaminophilum DSM 3953 TaxID=1286171 RepID=W8T979_PEPAC|nr:DUF2877 domain-containing protein [Peptoclostridium acidaminophilum]AHM58214.1 hypothetical protein EAL2_808p07110 [Peptoclostridium acidaminophilum DSM 3953]
MEKSFYAISFDDGFANMVDAYGKGQNEIAGRVHSLFKRVVNFTDSNGQMYSILDKNLDNGPYAARVDFKDNDNLHECEIKLNDEVIIKNNSLNIGNAISIKFDMCRIWQPQKINIRVDEIDIKQFRDNIDLYRRRLIDSQIRGGCSYYHIKGIAGVELYKAVLMERELDRRISNLIASLKSGGSELEKDIIPLVGLGNGLTPSGDDFISGFISALGVIKDERAKAALERIKSVLKRSVISTTDISRTMINASLEGKYRESIASFIGAILRRDKQELNLCIDKVLSIGSTSGADLSSGVIAGLEYGLNILGNGGL